MSMDLSGSAAFTAYVRDLGLSNLLPIFEENGWDTFSNFAFSVPTGSKDEYFEDKVVPILLKLETPDGEKDAASRPSAVRPGVLCCLRGHETVHGAGGREPKGPYGTC